MQTGLACYICEESVVSCSPSVCSECNQACHVSCLANFLESRIRGGCPRCGNQRRIDVLRSEDDVLGFTFPFEHRFTLQPTQSTSDPRGTVGQCTICSSVTDAGTYGVGRAECVGCGWIGHYFCVLHEMETTGGSWSCPRCSIRDGLFRILRYVHRQMPCFRKTSIPAATRKRKRE